MDKINASQLRVDQKIFVKGEVVFSRIASHIAGEELEKDKQRRMRSGMMTIDKPYTTLTISNAEIIPSQPNGLTTEEQFIKEKFYTGKKSDGTVDPVLRYTIQNKSPFLTTVSQYDPDTKVAQQIDLKGNELAVGLKVIVCLRTFQSKNFTANKSISLDNVIIMEPIRYYTGAHAADLSSLGLTFNPLPPEEAREAMNPVKENESTQSVPAAPVEPQTQADVQNPYATSPIPAVMPAPVQAAPVDAPWICPNCGATVPASQKFCGSCGAAKALGGGNPYAEQHNTGIAFDPNETRRDY